MPTFDNRLTEWVVKPGDPAAKAVSTLRRHGFETIVLPRSVYTRGVVGEPPAIPEADAPYLVFRIREAECVALIS